MILSQVSFLFIIIKKKKTEDGIVLDRRSALKSARLAPSSGSFSFLLWKRKEMESSYDKCSYLPFLLSLNVGYY